jgi:glycosyltransferase involved in cell wall biosynthesis
LLYSADINAACPNAVIEALACGTPVLAFDTGALPELVTDGSGRVVPYGSNPWELEKPDLPALAESAVEILLNQAGFRTGARQRAETLFGLDQMVNSYLIALYPS